MGYKVCPYCGANLDAGEKCDCRDEVATSQQENGGGRNARSCMDENKKGGDLT